MNRMNGAPINVAMKIPAIGMKLTSIIMKMTIATKMNNNVIDLVLITPL